MLANAAALDMIKADGRHRATASAQFRTRSLTSATTHAFATMPATRFPTARQAVNPGDSMHRRMHNGGVLAIAADHEIRKRLVLRMQLRPDAAARQPEIVQRHLRQDLPRRLDEVLQPQTVALVVVLRRGAFGVSPAAR